MRTSRAAHLLSQRRLRATAAEAHPHLERWHEQKRTRRPIAMKHLYAYLFRSPFKDKLGKERVARLGVAEGGWRTGNLRGGR